MNRRLADSLAAQAAVIVVVRILIGVIVAFVALRTLSPVELLPQDAARIADPGGGAVGNSFIRWDALHYLYVAATGYHQITYAPWFPLYPGLGRIFMHVPGLTPVWAMLTVSWISLFLAVWGTMALAKRLWPDANVKRIGLLLAWTPVSVFLLSGYPQALFIAEVAWAFYFVVGKKYFVAAAIAALASATRTEGIVLAGAVALGALIDKKWIAVIPIFVIGQLGAIAFAIYSKGHFGSYLSFFDAQTFWGREKSTPFYPQYWSARRMYETATGDPHGLTDHEFLMFFVDDMAVLVAFVVLGWLIYKSVSDRRLVVMAVYCAISLISIVSSGTAQGLTPESAARFAMCLVPLYLVAAKERNKEIWSNLLTGSIAVAVGLQIYSNVGGWVT